MNKWRAGYLNLPGSIREIQTREYTLDTYPESLLLSYSYLKKKKILVCFEGIGTFTKQPVTISFSFYWNLCVRRMGRILKGWDGELNLKFILLFIQQTSVEHLEHLKCSAKNCIELEINKVWTLAVYSKEKRGVWRTRAKKLFKGSLSASSLFKLEMNSEHFLVNLFTK